MPAYPSGAPVRVLAVVAHVGICSTARIVAALGWDCPASQRAVPARIVATLGWDCPASQRAVPARIVATLTL
jgi:hypothetical protein